MSQPGLQPFQSIDPPALLAARDATDRLLSVVRSVQANARIWAEYGPPELTNLDAIAEVESELTEILDDEEKVRAARTSVCHALTRELRLSIELSCAGELPSYRIGEESFATAHEAVHHAGELALAFCIGVRIDAEAEVPPSKICALVRSITPQGFLAIDCGELRVGVSREWAAATAMIGNLAASEESDMFQPVAWFKERLRPKLDDSSFRHAAREGKLRAITGSNKKLYSVADARRLWPDRFHDERESA